MKIHLKRKVKLFGFSVPISALFLFVLTVGVALAFIVSFTGSVDLTGRASVSMAYSNLTCTVANSGVNDSCVLGGNTFTAGYSDLDNTSIMTINFRAEPNNPVIAHFDPGTLPAGVSSVTCTTQVGSTPCEGLAIGSSFEQDLKFVIEVADMTGGQVIAALPLQIQFED